MVMSDQVRILTKRIHALPVSSFMMFSRMIKKSSKVHSINMNQRDGHLSHIVWSKQTDFKDYPADEYTNLVYVVSDGIETCDGNPVEVAESLSDSEIHPIVNVIGFGVD